MPTRKNGKKPAVLKVLSMTSKPSRKSLVPTQSPKSKVQSKAKVVAKANMPLSNITDVYGVKAPKTKVRIVSKYAKKK